MSSQLLGFSNPIASCRKAIGLAHNLLLGIGLPAVLACSVLLTTALHAQTANALDMVAFGNEESEKIHQVVTDHAENFRGGLNEPAVRLLPLTPPSFDGGSASFIMKVDPEAQNYVTVRLWGSDKGVEQGQLVLYADGKQVGYRKQSDYDLLNQSDDDPMAPGRFFYETRPLPRSMTDGKTSISLKIAVIGRIWPYGTYFKQYQKDLVQPSRGIYKVYTHTNPRIDLAKSEKQGSAPKGKLRATAGPEVIDKTKQIVIDRIDKVLKSPIGNGWGDLWFLPEAYNTPWTAAYRNPVALERVLKEGDALAAKFASDPNFDNGWLGAGILGAGIVRMWPSIGEHLDEPITVQGTEVPRRQAWSKAMRRSVDFWRTHRRYFTNQAMLVDCGIYASNRGLQLIDMKNALPEAQALRYVREAVGLAPWMDSDVIDEKGERPSNPFNGAYYLVTRKNLSRELGWVGTYGETILHITRDLADITQDEQVRQQLAKIQAARLIFRYPGVDGDGYSTMKLVSEVCGRVAHFPYHGSAYGAAAVRESWGMDVAAILPDDPISVGAAQRFIADGQYYGYIDGRLKDQDTLGMMRNVDEYNRIKTLAPVTYKFPMEDGQPDFVFSDEENAIVALKHKDTRLFVNLYFRAENAVNNVAKILDLTPSNVRLVTAKTQSQVIDSGTTYTRPDYVDWIRGDGMKPPGQDLHQAWAGEKLAISARPEGAPEPKYGGFGPFVGRAAFYWLTYGDYLIGVNTTDTNSYDLPVPATRPTYTDLVSQKSVTPANGVVSVPPRSTVVLYLGEPEAAQKTGGSSRRKRS